MTRFLFLFLVVMLQIGSYEEGKRLKVNLIASMNGKGLEADKITLENALKSLGCSVRFIERCDPYPVYHADVNIFFEKPLPDIFPYAPLNWFVPNPEWCYESREVLDHIDLILCRTKEVERIFTGLSRKTYLLGFSTRDASIEGVVKDFNACIHVAGCSFQKGTWAVATAWVRNPKFPHITVVRLSDSPFGDLSNFTWFDYRLPLEQLRTLQNQSGIHLCLSETEGYGHYLMEAMSCGAVVLTTDAPPMNEFILDPRCLVPYDHKVPQLLATNYYVSAEALETSMKKLLYLPREERMAIGAANRARYLQLKQQFLHRLQLLIEATKHHLLH